MTIDGFFTLQHTNHNSTFFYIQPLFIQDEKWWEVLVSFGSAEMAQVHRGV